MEEDTKRLLWVLGAVVVAVLSAVGWWYRREGTRPQLVGAWVVVRGGDHSLPANGRRLFPPGTAVEAGVVLEVRRGKSQPERLCPYPEVELHGQRVSCQPLERWPSAYGVLKVQWFTVEPALFGWETVDEKTAEKLRLKDFAAPEMGFGFSAPLTLEAHNDDFLSQPLPGNQLPGGMVRLKAKVSAYREERDLLPWASVSSPGAEDPLRATAVAIGVSLPPPIHPHLAFGLRLGVFSFAPGIFPTGGQLWPLPLTPAELVREFVIATPEGLAALAATGNPLARPWGRPVAVVWGEGGRLRARGAQLRWGKDCKAADAVVVGERWAVLVADDGDGWLSAQDQVLLAAHRPAALVSLAEAFGGQGRGHLLRREVQP